MKIEIALLTLLALLPLSAFASPPILPVTLDASIEQPAYREGQPVMLALALHNSSADALSLGGSAYEESAFQIFVTDSHGAAVPRTAFGERVLTPPTTVEMNYRIVLGAEKTLSYRFNLARLFDLSHAGDYDVKVSRELRPQIILNVGSLKIHLEEAAPSHSGPTGQAPTLSNRTFLYIADGDYSNERVGDTIVGSGSAVLTFHVWPDGSVSSTLNPHRLTEQAISAIAATPDGRFLYVGSGKSVLQFRVGANGLLVPLSPSAIPAQAAPQPLLMDPKGRFLYALSGQGNTLYAVGREGQLTTMAVIPIQEWAGNQERHVMPAGSFAFDPTGTYLYGCNNAIVGYHLNSMGRVVAALRIQQREPQKILEGLTLGQQNADVVLTPSGRFAFVLAGKYTGPPDNITATSEEVVLPMRITAGGDLSLLPGEVTPCDAAGMPLNCQNLALDSTGQVLFAFASSSDVIAPYRIGPAGSLTPLPLTLHIGGPVHLFSVPGSPFLYALTQFPPSLQAFQVDPNKGLVPAGVDMPANEVPFTSSVAVANAPTLPLLGSVSGGLQLAAYLPGDVVPTDKPVVLTVTLKNVSNHLVHLGTLGADMASFRLAVSRPQRQSPGGLRGGGEPLAASVPLLAAGHDLLDAPGPSTVPVILPPGGQRQYRFVLSRLADLTVAGNYTVQITRTLSGGAVVTSPVVPFLVDGPFNGRIRDSKYSVQIL